MATDGILTYNSYIMKERLDYVQGQFQVGWGHNRKANFDYRQEIALFIVQSPRRQAKSSKIDVYGQLPQG
jgi:hypothetical protein